MQGLGHREQPHRHQHDLDAVQQFGHPAGVARLAGDLVQADQAHGQTDEQGGQATQGALSEHRTHRGERQQHQHEIFRRAELDREFGNHRRKQGHHDRGDRARDERTDGGRGQRRTGAPALGHLVAFHGRDHAGGFARGVQQDRRGRAAVHGTVIDAGKEDHRRRRIHLGRDRQQHGHCRGRTDTWKHADGGAQRTTDKRPQQVDRRARRDKALNQLAPDVHHNHPLCVRPGRLMARNFVNIQ